MKKILLSGIVVCVSVVIGVCGNEAVKSGEVKKLADGFKFTEGPAAGPDGAIYFTDIPNNRIQKWSKDGKLSTFRENSGGANGLMFDKNGNLLICEGGNRRVVSLSPAGKVTVLADSYKGKKLNKPNDLWIDPKGGIYFTDPHYGKGRELIEQDGEHVYYLAPGKKELVRVIDDMVRPNGIIGTPDGKILYVTDHGGNKTFSYKVNKDGTLSKKKLLADAGSDGMTLDKEGNVYLTTDKVEIYSPGAKKIGSITVPERPANVCFGGENGRTLFITARKSFYCVEVQAR